MGNIIKIFATILAGSTAWACSTDGCTGLRSAIPKAEFYSSTTAKVISLDSLQISGVGAPGDSILMTAGTSASSVYLPFRSQQDATSWCLSYKWRDTDDPRLNDTVTFHYSSQPYFASAECGAMYRYTVHKVDYTTHLLDSVVMVDSLITNIDVSQIRFYFRTQEEGGTE